MWFSSHPTWLLKKRTQRYDRPALKQYLKEPPVKFEPDRFNKGRKCRGVSYIRDKRKFLKGGESFVEDAFCFQLQDDLYKAAIAGDTIAMRSLLRRGADANGVGPTLYSWQEPALLFAAGKGQSESVKLLLDNGARLEVKDEMDMTPLFRAVSNGHTETVNLLLFYGANVNAESMGMMPLTLAKEHGYKDIVALLQEASACE